MKSDRDRINGFPSQAVNYIPPTDGYARNTPPVKLAAPKPESQLAPEPIPDFIPEPKRTRLERKVLRADWREYHERRFAGLTGLALLRAAFDLNNRAQPKAKAAPRTPRGMKRWALDKRTAVHERTKSEARAHFKRLLGVDRLPPGTLVHAA